MKLRRPLTISFEFFPPKTLEGMGHLCEAANTLAAFSPSFFSVTYGAGGTTRKGSIETVKMLQETTAIKIAPHLACIGSSRYDILKMLHHFKSANIRHIVALRGDLPADMDGPSECKYACELVALIRETTADYFHIEVAAYPEIHPEALTALDDILNLKRKYEAGANSAITQYFFNPDAYFYLRDECAKQQIDLPIIPGIMPITQFARLVRFSDACGAEIPRWIKKRLESYGEDLTAIKKFGLEVVFNLCERLIAGGVPGLHFYTLNRAEGTVALLNSLFGGEASQLQQVKEHKKVQGEFS